MSLSINSNTTNSFSPKHQNGLLRPVYNSYYNNTNNLDSNNFTSITTEESSSNIRSGDSFNNTLFLDHINEENETSSNYNNNNNNNNDINPRKHSPGL